MFALNDFRRPPVAGEVAVDQGGHVEAPPTTSAGRGTGGGQGVHGTVERGQEGRVARELAVARGGRLEESRHGEGRVRGEEEEPVSRHPKESCVGQVVQAVVL